jgi:hypothetical protein
VPDEELKNPTKLYFNCYKQDLIYTGINVKVVLRFPFQSKIKEEGMLKSHDDMKKCKDAIMWGAKVAGQQLPTSLYAEMNKFLQAYKNEIAQEKKRGTVKDVSSDPINTTLYGLLMLWAIETNNVFVWAWTVLQWNFIGRLSSIDPLGFHNFSLGSDSTIGKYYDSKADKAGERLTAKNLYANPFDWLECSWTAIGSIWCALEAPALAEHERLFLEHLCNGKQTNNKILL